MANGWQWLRNSLFSFRLSCWPAGRPSLLLWQTCQLALDLIAWRRKQAAGRGAAVPVSKDGTKSDANPYLSVDPAPSCGEGGDDRGEDGSGLGTGEMGKRLRDKDRSLFERYR